MKRRGNSTGFRFRKKSKGFPLQLPKENQQQQLHQESPYLDVQPFAKQGASGASLSRRTETDLADFGGSSMTSSELRALQLGHDDDASHVSAM